MKIISVSLEKSGVDEIDEALELTGMKSRSKLIRHAMNEFLGRQKSLSKLSGSATVVFMITHPHLHKTEVTSAIHGYESLVKTVLHHHSKRGCLDILIAEGEAFQIKQLYKKLENMEGVEGVNFSII